MISKLLFNLLIVRKIPFYHFKLITEWLGCYHYIIPDDRIIIPQFKHILVNITNSYIQAHCLEDHIKTCLNETQQKELLKWILDSDHFHTAADSHYIHARESINSIE